jgi:hypothetical protein
VGKPGKFGAEQKQAYLDRLCEMPIKSHAAGLLGLTRQAIDYHRSKDEDFATAELKALEIGRRKLLKGVDDDKWLLQKSDPATYTDQTKIQHEGNVTVNVDGSQWMPKGGNGE